MDPSDDRGRHHVGRFYGLIVPFRLEQEVVFVSLGELRLDKFPELIPSYYGSNVSVPLVVILFFETRAGSVY